MSSEDKKQAPAPEGSGPPADTTVYHDQATDATSAYTYYDDYGYEQSSPETAVETAAPEATAVVPHSTPAGPPPPPPPSEPQEDEEDDGMLRMSFLEHLEELRARILSALIGMGVAFVACIGFSERIWSAIQGPATEALKAAGVVPPKLAVTTPTEAFSIIWVKVPVLVSLFLASPWILYQVWSFVSPGLYKHERKWAAPFVISSASLFVIGGAFAYFVAFPLGLGFLLGIATGNDLTAVVTITEYFDLFFNVTLGLGIVFELPILIFFLSLLRIVTPAFLMRNSRYAILIIVIVAAVLTPTPDVINLMLISVPMMVLYFAGVLASYLLFLSRENKKFPWMLILLGLIGVLAVTASFVFAAVRVYGFRLVDQWPYLVK